MNINSTKCHALNKSMVKLSKEINGKMVRANVWQLWNPLMQKFSSSKKVIINIVTMCND